MLSATAAGSKARTTVDASLPQESSATPCDECQQRAADGVTPDGRSLCRACAKRSRTLVCDGGIDVEAVDNDDTENERLPSPTRTYESFELRRLKPGFVITDASTYSVDHVETLSSVVRCVNYDDAGDLEEVVSFPWHRIEAIEWYPADEARESSPYDNADPLASHAVGGENDE